MAFENSPHSGGRTCVVVGLDFGTTFSGISYAPLTKSEAKSFYWTVNSNSAPKTPTKIHGLDPNKVEDPDTNLEWFKLSLPHPEDLPSDVQNSPKFKALNVTRATVGITAKDATAIYIKKIWKAFLKELQKKIPDPFIQLSVTVPTLWPEDACRAMYEALNRADILNENVVLAPKLLAEPEAAALAFFSDSHYLEEMNTSRLKPGQTFLICDCGGGTVDTAAYTISSVHPFRVDELRAGRCIVAGACLLDDGFMKLLKEKAEPIISPRVFGALTDKDLQDITNVWELEMKVDFRDNYPTRQIYLPIKWAASRQKRKRVGQGEEVTFTHDDIASIFDPIVGKITHLIEEEMLEISAKLSNDVSHLVVAGGFGQNVYLRQRIAETVARVSPNTNLLDYPKGDGWNAVSMGAVAHALQALAMQQPVLVTSRIVRSGWGVLAGHGNSIIWLVKENESLDATRPNLRNIPVEALSAEYHTGGAVFSIRVCRTDPRKNEGQGYRDVCRLRWKPDTNADLKAPLQIELRWDGAEMEFSLYCAGVQQSSVDIEYCWNI